MAENAARYYRRDVPDDLSSRINAARRKLELNQQEFAKALGVNQATVSRWEKGSHHDGLMLARRAGVARAISTVKMAIFRMGLALLAALLPPIRPK